MPIKLDRTGIYFSRHKMMLGADSVYTIEDHDQKVALFPKTIGYAIGARGRWRVYDGSLDAESRWGNFCGRVATLDEAAQVLKNYHNEEQS